MNHFFPKIKAACMEHPLITGSFLLTLAGFISRLIGFFYRMYLSQLFGEEGMGIYQLVGPVMALSFSLTAAGFQTSISKFVAEQTGNAETGRLGIYRPLLLGLSISLPLSFLLMFFIQSNALFIATSFLQEPRTAPLLRILALSLPLSAAHACINGFFYGCKKAAIPAICQLVEQIFRVLSVYIIATLALSQGNTPTLNITCIGILLGEIAATLLSIVTLLGHTKRPLSATYNLSTNHPLATTGKCLTYGMLLSMAIPLIANRITLNILQSIETVSLPARLRMYGYDQSTALSVYGVLTGMAFPLLFFPNAITSAFAVLLLPLISESVALGDKAGVRKLTLKTIRYCSLLGFSCMFIFLLFGNHLGRILFHSQLAGLFIRTLSFICPFMYLNNTLSAILQGMGKVIPLFFINVSSLLLRLIFIFTFVPTHGIKGYLWGLLAGQLYQCAIYLFTINRTQKR